MQPKDPVQQKINIFFFNKKKEKKVREPVNPHQWQCVWTFRTCDVRQPGHDSWLCF